MAQNSRVRSCLVEGARWWLHWLPEETTAGMKKSMLHLPRSTDPTAPIIPRLPTIIHTSTFLASLPSFSFPSKPLSPPIPKKIPLRYRLHDQVIQDGFRQDRRAHHQHHPGAGRKYSLFSPSPAMSLPRLSQTSARASELFFCPSINTTFSKCFTMLITTQFHFILLNMLNHLPEYLL